MTDDYKKTLIEYVTGNLETTSPTTDEIFKEINEIPRSKWVYKYSPKSWNKLNIEGFIKPSENTSNIGIVYGGYQVYNSQEIRGFIILTDIDFNPIKYIEEFNSGTKLRYIQCMIQGDDNLFYAIDDEAYSYNNYNPQNSQKRFLMLNNFTVAVNDEYQVSLRRSYILNGSNYQNFYCNDIFKENNSSHFVFCGKYSPGAGQIASYIKSIELKVNVGQPNEWNYWQINENYSYLCSFVTYNNENEIKIQTLGIKRSGFNVNLFVKDYNSNSYVSNVIKTLSFTLDVEPYISQQALFLDANNIYFVIDTQGLSGYIPSTGEAAKYERYVNLYHYDIANNNFETIHQDYYGNYAEVIQHSKIQLDKNQGNLYIAYYKNINQQNCVGDYYIQRYEGIWNPILIGENKPMYYQTRRLYVKSNYNLLQINLFNGELAATAGGKPIWYFLNIKEIYNSTQYNGEPYIDTNVLSPLYANLYSNGSLVFSRNLYNISKQNNMTMSSVEIPNNYLNDDVISQNDLISKTNIKMNEIFSSWTKNIYEVVDVNFLNTISVIDEDTNTPYLESAIKVNNATTDGGDTNYQNTPCNKYRINYLDGTTSIGALVWNSINNYNKKTQITFYVDKEINSIDLISNDESVIYLTIPIEAEVGKYYTINQKVRTGDKPTPVQLQYNNEDINYQNQPVMVYVEEE